MAHQMSKPSALLPGLKPLLSGSGVQGCVEGIPYPPKTLSAGVEALCLQGNTDAAARKGKLALLLYACLDMGQTVDMASFRSALPGYWSGAGCMGSQASQPCWPCIPHQPVPRPAV